jgi:polyhydroxyalkanoate synthesis regulator phasin
MRQTIKIAVVVLVVAALSMTGLALAQESEGGTEDSTEGTAPFADFKERILEQLQGLVDNGIISGDQANAVADNLTQAREDRAAAREERREQQEADRQEVLDTLGMTAAELREAFGNGQTLADVAETQGVDIQDIIDLKVSQVSDHLAQAVEDGKLTQAEADEKLAEVTERITESVNQAPGEGGFGRGHRHGGGFGPGGGPGFGPGGPPEGNGAEAGLAPPFANA